MSVPNPTSPTRIFLRFVFPLLVAGAALLWWRNAPAPEVAAPEPTPAASGSSQAPAAIPVTPPSAPSAAPADNPTRPEPSAVATVATMPAMQERIDALVVTYAKESLPALAPYLTHQDPAVREAAREGFLQMGLTEGSAYLRAAADQIRDPREAVQLLDAADFLDLPAVPSTGGRAVHPVSPAYRERLQNERANRGP